MSLVSAGGGEGGLTGSLGQQIRQVSAELIKKTAAAKATLDIPKDFNPSIFAQESLRFEDPVIRVTFGREQDQE